MKRFVKVLAALFAALICLSSFAALADTAVVTTGDVHMRNGVGTGCASLAVIGRNTRLCADSIALDHRNVAWYRVSYNGRTGWISSAYTAPDAAAGYVTTTGKVYLRRGAGTDYAAVTSIAKNATLSFNRTAKDERGVIWFHVTYGSASGWISSIYARQNDAPAPAAGTVVASARLNIRRGAGTEYRVVGAIDANRAASWLGEAKKDSANVTWYKISYAGVTGWVSSLYASLI